MCLAELAQKSHDVRISVHTPDVLGTNRLRSQGFQPITRTSQFLLPDTDCLSIDAGIFDAPRFAQFVVELDDLQPFLSGSVGTELAQARQHLGSPPVVWHSTEDGESVHRDASFQPSVDAHVRS